MAWLTSVHGDLQILTFGLGPLATWQAQALGSLVDHWKGIIPERIINKIMKNMGDLGIEPRSHFLRDNTSTTKPSAFLCLFSGRWILYLKNKCYTGQIKKSANFQIYQSHAYSSASSSWILHFAWKYKLDSGGFKPPLTQTCKNND